MYKSGEWCINWWAQWCTNLKNDVQIGGRDVQKSSKGWCTNLGDDVQIGADGNCEIYKPRRRGCTNGKGGADLLMVSNCFNFLKSNFKQLQGTYT